MNYNSSNNSNSSYIFSQTKTKEIPSALFPIMSTGFNSYASYPSRDIMTNLNNSLILESCSPHPIPKYNIDNSLPASNGSFDRLEESDSQKEGHTITNNCSMAKLQREAFDSTSGREEWAEEHLQPNGETDGGSGSTRLFHSENAPDQISASNTSHIDDDKLGFDCMSHIDTVVTICLAIVSFSTPILMALLPKFMVFGWSNIICTATCEFTLMFTAFKLCILSIASLVLYCRRQTYSFPRVLILKVVLIMLLFFIIFTFWLFYVLRILMVNDKKTASDYDNIISYCSNVTDILLFLHYLSIVMLEIRHLDSRFCIKIVRSPDGESRFYKVGNISIQVAAIKILQNYVLDFPMFNVYSRSTHRTSLSRDSNQEMLAAKIKTKSNTIQGESLVEKVYSSGDKDRHSPLRRSTRSLGQSPHGSRHDKFPRSLTQSDIGFSGFKERLYKEMEHEKRLKKRRLRLMASGEDTFNRLKRHGGYEEEGRNWAANETSAKVLTSSEAAQNILAQLAKPFQKYLKLSRLQPHFPKLRIINHLVKCLQFGMSAQAFLENFISTPRVIESSESINGQIWTVICNKSLCRGLSNNMTFLLKREGISLMCSVYHIPIFSLSEDIYDLESQKFIIKFNSETSV